MARSFAHTANKFDNSRQKEVVDKALHMVRGRIDSLALEDDWDDIETEERFGRAVPKSMSRSYWDD